MQEDREADIVAVGGVQVPVMGEENEREITIEEVKRELNETKGGKAPGMDGVRVEMLKEGGVTVLEWLVSSVPKMVKVSCRCKSHHVYLCNFLSC